MKKHGKNSFLGRYADIVIHYRYVIVVATVLVCILLGLGKSRIGFSSDYHYYFGQVTPEIEAMEELDKTYANSDSIYFAVSPQDGGTVFKREILSAVAELTDKAWLMPFVIRVDSVVNFQHTRVVGEDDLIVEDLVREPTKLTAVRLEAIKQEALAEPFLVNRMISADGNHTGINAVLRLPGESPQETATAVAQARKLAKIIERNYPVKVRLSGVHVMNNAFGEIGMMDIQNLIPVMYGLMILILFALFRSFTQVSMTVVVVHLSTIAAMGLVGWLGILLTAPSSIAPTIILSLAVADSVHIIKTFVNAVRAGKSKHDAVRESMRLNFKPVFLTTITTAFGFLALNFADAPPYHDLGNITAMGVSIAYVLSITLLPAMLAILPNRIRSRDEVEQQRSARAWRGLARFVTQRRTVIIVGFVLLTAGLSVSIPKLVLDDRWVEYFSKDTVFRNDADFVQKNLTGMYSVEFNLKAKGPNEISDPTYLNAVAAFADFYRSQSNVYNVSTITDTLKRLNRSLHNDDEQYYRLPEERPLAAQYLLLYELSLPYGLDLTNQLSMNKSSTKFVVTFRDVSTVELRTAVKLGEDWLRENAPDYIQTIGSGATVIFAHQSDINIQGMMFGTTLSLLLISLTIFIALRNTLYGTISVLINVLPFAMTFGAWTLLMGKAGMEVSIVVSATLGVIVDNCVHFLTKYIHARKEKGLDLEAALVFTFDHVGSALIFTSITLITGYSILMLSDFALNRALGVLSALTVGFALAVILILLPALLSRFSQTRMAEQLRQKELATVTSQ
ncbi:MAG: MMPL family transporter [Candidatus Thiodiazotropha sp. (ex Rostrolucina anterorostrata)]|nr:MMPL family transporter [Candidatus Thiodiazotropha sp. (ex Rostrolucina anterorostrata)]